MPEPLTREQGLHVRDRTNHELIYLHKLKTALEARGHTKDHTYYRMVVEAWEAVVTLNRASLYVAHEAGFSVRDGSLTTGPIPSCHSE